MQYSMKLQEEDTGLRPVNMYIDALKGTNLNDRFWKWFGKSEIRNEDGTPKIVYHGTRGIWKPADRFVASIRNDLGIHLGTKDQAHRIVFPTPEEGEKVDLDNSFYKFMRIYPCYLRMENPLDMDDPVTWDMGSMGETLIDLYIMDEKEVFKLTKLYNKNYFGVENRPANADETLIMIQDRMTQALEEAGYDGIRYENQTEGTGESYMVFHPNQVKSIFNRGTWSNRTGNLNESQTKR